MSLSTALHIARFQILYVFTPRIILSNYQKYPVPLERITCGELY